MKSIIQEYLNKALESMPIDSATFETLTIPVEYTRSNKHGDFSSSIALNLAKSLNTNPLLLAQQITTQLNNLSFHHKALFHKIEAVKPGFINFFVHPKAWLDQLPMIINKGDQYGVSESSHKKPILVEFVSSNPTGPLHVGHGRAAALGDILVRLLKTVGYNVSAEYYINDAGRQVDILACSIWLRYLEAKGEVFNFPSNAYQGGYIRDIAADLAQHHGDIFYHASAKLTEDLPLDEPQGGDKEKFIDAVIIRAKTLLGEKNYTALLNFGLQSILKDMQEDLTEFGVTFDRWFSEKSLIEAGRVTETIQLLTERGHTYEAEGNLWFRSTTFGDDKDRVLLRKNGQPTYFAVDAAYRLDILKNRKFDTIINLLGADHHGYLARIHAVVKALGYKEENVIFSTLQMVSLYRGKEKLALSTRSGEFITLRALREEVGHDATRLFFVLRRASQAIDFDLELAKSQSHQNPVYYLQYAYARIKSVMRQLEAKELTWNIEKGLAAIEKLTLEEEMQLIKQLTRYPDIIEQAALQYEPSVLVQYLRDLAKAFHAYYNHTPVLNQEEAVRDARLTLFYAMQVVLKNGFSLLGIQALERM